MTYHSDYIKQTVGIRQVCEHYGLKLKRNMCCCPFHSEKTPSFSINEQKNIFKCFGCGVGGDIFTFVQHYLNCDFKTALNEIVDIFHLGNQGKVSRGYILSHEEEKRKKKQFDDWCSNAYTILTDYFKRLKSIIESECIFDISNVSNECEMAFKSIDFVDYLIEFLRTQDRIEFYKLYRKEVAKIERGISGCASGLYQHIDN